MSKFPIHTKPFGIHAILVEWPNEVMHDILEDILQFQEYLSQKLDPNQWEFVPAYNSLTLIQRDEQIEFDTFKVQLLEWYSEKEAVKPRQKYLWRLPVCYDLDFGIDLPEIAERLQIPIPKIIALHAENIYTIYGIGFLPGFMYLGGLAEVLEVPRRATPRLKVVKGAVGMAGKQTGIYPQESPGGWNIIGNCSIPIFDANQNPPSFVTVGDQIQFYPISRAEYNLHKIEGEVGIYKIEKIKLNA